MPPPASFICFKAAWSCGPQSHFRLPRISPVTHCECSRTRGGVWGLILPTRIAKCSSLLAGCLNITIFASVAAVSGNVAVMLILISGSLSSVSFANSYKSRTGMWKPSARRACWLWFRAEIRLSSAAGISLRLGVAGTPYQVGYQHALPGYLHLQAEAFHLLG